MTTRESFTGWHRNRFVWVAAIMLTAAGAVVALVGPAGSDTDSEDLQGRIVSRMRTTLEQADPQQHNHAGHTARQVNAAAADPAVICGVRVYGHEPAEATAFTDVKTVYGFHLCGVAEPDRHWDVAVKLAGPVIMDMTVQPPGIQVVEATAEVMYVDRLRQMFPPKYAELALTEALSDAEMAQLRRRYDDAAGL